MFSFSRKISSLEGSTLLEALYDNLTLNAGGLILAVLGGIGLVKAIAAGTLLSLGAGWIAVLAVLTLGVIVLVSKGKPNYAVKLTTIAVTASIATGYAAPAYGQAKATQAMEEMRADPNIMAALRRLANKKSSQSKEQAKDKKEQASKKLVGIDKVDSKGRRKIVWRKYSSNELEAMKDLSNVYFLENGKLVPASKKNNSQSSSKPVMKPVSQNTSGDRSDTNSSIKTPVRKINVSAVNESDVMRKTVSAKVTPIRGPPVARKEKQSHIVKTKSSRHTKEAPEYALPWKWFGVAAALAAAIAMVVNSAKRGLIVLILVALPLLLMTGCDWGTGNNGNPGGGATPVDTPLETIAMQLEDAGLPAQLYLANLISNPQFIIIDNQGNNVLDPNNVNYDPVVAQALLNTMGADYTITGARRDYDGVVGWNLRANTAIDFSQYTKAISLKYRPFDLSNVADDFELVSYIRAENYQNIRVIVHDSRWDPANPTPLNQELLMSVGKVTFDVTGLNDQWQKLSLPVGEYKRLGFLTDVSEIVIAFNDLNPNDQFNDPLVQGVNGQLWVDGLGELVQIPVAANDGGAGSTASGQSTTSFDARSGLTWCYAYPQLDIDGNLNTSLLYNVSGSDESAGAFMRFIPGTLTTQTETYDFYGSPTSGEAVVMYVQRAASGPSSFVVTFEEVDYTITDVTDPARYLQYAAFRVTGLTAENTWYKVVIPVELVTDFITDFSALNTMSAVFDRNYMLEHSGRLTIKEGLFGLTAVHSTAGPGVESDLNMTSCEAFTVGRMGETLPPTVNYGYLQWDSYNSDVIPTFHYITSIDNRVAVAQAVLADGELQSLAGGDYAINLYRGDAIAATDIGPSIVILEFTNEFTNIDTTTGRLSYRVIVHLDNLGWNFVAMPADDILTALDTANTNHINNQISISILVDPRLLPDTERNGAVSILGTFNPFWANYAAGQGIVSSLDTFGTEVYTAAQAGEQLPAGINWGYLSLEDDGGIMRSVFNYDLSIDHRAVIATTYLTPGELTNLTSDYVINIYKGDIAAAIPVGPSIIALEFKNETTTEERTYMVFARLVNGWNEISVSLSDINTYLDTANIDGQISISAIVSPNFIDSSEEVGAITFDGTFDFDVANVVPGQGTPSALNMVYNTVFTVVTPGEEVSPNTNYGYLEWNNYNSQIIPTFNYDTSRDNRAVVAQAVLADGQLQTLAGGDYVINLYRGDAINTVDNGPSIVLLDFTNDDGVNEIRYTVVVPLLNAGWNTVTIPADDILTALSTATINGQVSVSLVVNPHFLAPAQRSGSMTIEGTFNPDWATSVAGQGTASSLATSSPETFTVVAPGEQVPGQINYGYVGLVDDGGVIRTVFNYETSLDHRAVVISTELADGELASLTGDYVVNIYQGDVSDAAVVGPTYITLDFINNDGTQERRYQVFVSLVAGWNTISIPANDIRTHLDTATINGKISIAAVVNPNLIAAGEETGAITFDGTFDYNQAAVTSGQGTASDLDMRYHEAFTVVGPGEILPQNANYGYVEWLNYNSELKAVFRYDASVGSWPVVARSVLADDQLQSLAGGDYVINLYRGDAVAGTDTGASIVALDFTNSDGTNEARYTVLVPLTYAGWNTATISADEILANLDLANIFNGQISVSLVVNPRFIPASEHSGEITIDGTFNPYWANSVAGQGTASDWLASSPEAFTVVAPNEQVSGDINYGYLNLVDSAGVTLTALNYNASYDHRAVIAYVQLAPGELDTATGDYVINIYKGIDSTTVDGPSIMAIEFTNRSADSERRFQAFVSLVAGWNTISIPVNDIRTHLDTANIDGQISIAAVINPNLIDTAEEVGAVTFDGTFGFDQAGVASGTGIATDLDMLYHEAFTVVSGGQQLPVDANYGFVEWLNYNSELKAVFRYDTSKGNWPVVARSVLVDGALEAYAGQDYVINLYRGDAVAGTDTGPSVVALDFTKSNGTDEVRYTVFASLDNAGWNTVTVPVDDILATLNTIVDGQISVSLVVNPNLIPAGERAGSITIDGTFNPDWAARQDGRGIVSILNAYQPNVFTVVHPGEQLSGNVNFGFPSFADDSGVIRAVFNYNTSHDHRLVVMRAVLEDGELDRLTSDYAIDIYKGDIEDASVVGPSIMALEFVNETTTTTKRYQVFLRLEDGWNHITVPINDIRTHLDTANLDGQISINAIINPNLIGPLEEVGAVTFHDTFFFDLDGYLADVSAVFTEAPINLGPLSEIRTYVVDRLANSVDPLLRYHLEVIDSQQRYPIDFIYDVNDGKIRGFALVPRTSIDTLSGGNLVLRARKDTVGPSIFQIRVDGDTATGSSYVNFIAQNIDENWQQIMIPLDRVSNEGLLNITKVSLIYSK